MIEKFLVIDELPYFFIKIQIKFTKIKIMIKITTQKNTTKNNRANNIK